MADHMAIQREVDKRSPTRCQEDARYLSWLLPVLPTPRVAQLDNAAKGQHRPKPVLVHPLPDSATASRAASLAGTDNRVCTRSG